MDHDNVAVRSLGADDLDWVVDLAARCGDRRQSFAPRFWRRAPDARRLHARYLRSSLEDPAVRAMRTAHMFAFGVRRPGLLIVDDAAAERADHWATEGAALLRGLVGDARVRLVCPVPEPWRAALAAELGLRREETWWHRDLTERSSDFRSGELLPVFGAQARLVPAPAVYAPGGPVLLVTEVHDLRALTELEKRAEDHGAVVSVVAQAPEDGNREKILLTSGYRRTCDFYEGTLDLENARHQPSR